MSYGRVNKPRFYPDAINWMASRGWSREDRLTLKSGTIDTGAGYTKYQLIDLNAFNPCVFESIGSVTDIVIEVNQEHAARKIDFIAIMNHNLYDAGAFVQVNTHTATIPNAATGTQVALKKVIGCDQYATDTNNIDFDQYQVDSIAYFETATTNQYAAVIIQPIPGGLNQFDDDISIGAILIGYRYTMPNSGDMNIVRTQPFEGVTVRSTDAGKRYGHASWVAANDGDDYAPFRYDTGECHRRPGGRQAYDINFSYIADTDLFPEDWADVNSGSETDFITQVYNRTAGPMLPFIWTPDSTSTTEGDYMFARLMNEIKPQKVANRVWSFKNRIEEEL
jgi:hypothetical protein